MTDEDWEQVVAEERYREQEQRRQWEREQDEREAAEAQARYEYEMSQATQEAAIAEESANNTDDQN